MNFLSALTSVFNIYIQYQRDKVWKLKKFAMVFKFRHESKNPQIFGTTAFPSKINLIIPFWSMKNTTVCESSTGFVFQPVMT